MNSLQQLLLVLALVFTPTHSVKVVTTADSYAYRVEDEQGQTLFTGGDIAVFVSGKWCVHQQQQQRRDEEEDHWTLEPKGRFNLNGKDPILGDYRGEQMDWSCQVKVDDDGQSMSIPITTLYKNFFSSVLFEVEWPQGATGTNVTNSYTSALTHYPSLQSTPNLPSVLSWQGSMISSKRGYPEGTMGGPTVFYNASDPLLQTVVVASPWKFIWKSFSAGDNQDWRHSNSNDHEQWFSPGTSGRITAIPPGYRQSILLYQKPGGGITSTINAWGDTMRQTGKGFPKLNDLTLDKIGYQTDNGAFYCFCKEHNCSQTLLQKVQELKSLEVPMGYLSFQGAGASSGRGKAAPWCIDTWGVDGGQNPNVYPMDLTSFQKALGLPLQLYAPYFCPGSPYFEKGKSPWKSVPSDSNLPHCDTFDFQNVQPSQSKAFYDWFMDKGIQKAGMISFESDFMNQNYNCVPAFVTDISAAQEWQQGMTGAASDRGITVQWCYSSPTDVFASLDTPAVTNFRVSSDFCYGHSWEIGESSLLVWALGAVPSKDTLWSTDNNKTETPGCKWTPDHEESAAELHVVLALMSNGPVGLSDGLGYTNATLLQRIMWKDGTLLKPTKPITSVDSAFLDSAHSSLAAGSQGGFVYGTAGVGSSTGAEGTSWYFVSFLLPEEYEVRIRDFWPPPPLNQDNNQTYFFAYRTLFGDGSECKHGEDAVASGCVKLSTTASGDPSAGVFKAPPAPLLESNSNGDPSFAPTVTAVFQPCVESGWILLGELDKYVPLSPVRFQEVLCHTGGVSVKYKGAQGETIHLTALQPMGPQNGAEYGKYNVVVKHIPIITEDATLSVTFTSSDVVIDSQLI